MKKRVFILAILVAGLAVWALRERILVSLKDSLIFRCGDPKLEGRVVHNIQEIHVECFDGARNQVGEMDGIKFFYRRRTREG